ncbi:MAG: hypothetical protein ACTHU0_32950 [Kofleriaceae bacterium]
MYCSLDKIDLAARVDGEQVGVQTDHRARAEIEAEPELSALFAMARVLNARGHLADQGHPDAPVRYVVADEPPELLRSALAAVGATLERADRERCVEPLGAASEEVASALADRAFGALARRAAARIGTRDLAMALRMLEDQTVAAPPDRGDDEAYWSRVLELAALTGELLRAKYPSAGRWVQTDRAMVPFGFQLITSASGGSTVVFPTNRAQRVIEDGNGESLFKLLLAAEETMSRPPDAATGRLMPSLRDRRNVELDEVVWRSVLPESTGPADLPIIVCGIDGENTFGMMRREALERPADEVMAEALRNLAAEPVDVETLHADGIAMVVVSGGFYAAEKLLDRALMLRLHDELGAELLAAAVPTRGLLMVTAAHHEATQIARFAALARMRHDDAGGRAISPTVLLISEGKVAGFVRDATHHEAPRAARASSPRLDDGPEEDPDDVVTQPGGLRRLPGRK